jgi:hypothetical protein
MNYVMNFKQLESRLLADVIANSHGAKRLLVLGDIMKMLEHDITPFDVNVLMTAVSNFKA